MPKGIYHKTTIKGRFKKNCIPWNKGKSNCNFKTKNHRGYIMILCPNHPHPSAANGRYCFEHRLVMEKHLGRYLRPEERIHHKDHDKTNNKINNLELFKNTSEHSKNCNVYPYWCKSQPRGKHGNYIKKTLMVDKKS